MNPILENCRNFIKTQYEKRVTLFNNTDHQFSFSPLKAVTQASVILLGIFIVAFFLFQPRNLNESLVIKTSATKQTSQASVGQYVHWTMIIKKSDITNQNHLAKLPLNAHNIKITATTQDKATSQQTPQTPLTLQQKKSIASSNQPQKFFLASILNSLNKFFLSSLDNAAQSIIDSTNPQVQTTTEAKTVDLSADVSTQPLDQQVIEIDYTTPAPQITEQNTNNGKVVTVSDPTRFPSAPVTDVVAFTNIPEIFKVGEESKIQIKWKNNNNQPITLTAKDTDNNGKLDYVEWTVPHLSDQTFEIIFISKAFRLDSNQNIIEDIYPQVETQDNVWAAVSYGNYVRFTFQHPVEKNKTIDIYAKPTNANQPAKIEVYRENGDQAIATFNIDHEGMYHASMANLGNNPTDVFDFKIFGSIGLDYVQDAGNTYYPAAGSGSADWNSAGTWSASQGGAGGAGVPTASDDVIIEGVVGTQVYDIALDSATLDVCGSLTAQNVASSTNDPTLTFTGYKLIVGSGGVTFGSGYAGIVSTSTGILQIGGGTLTTNGVNIKPNLILNGNVTLGGAVNTKGYLQAASNSTISGSYAISCGGFNMTSYSLTSTTASINLSAGSPTWQASGSGGYVAVDTTITANTTITGTVYFSTRTLTYSSGTLTTTSSTLVMNSGTVTGFDATHPLNNLTGAGRFALGSDIYINGAISATVNVIMDGSYVLHVAGGITLTSYSLASTGNSITWTGGTWSSGGSSGYLAVNVTIAGNVTLSNDLYFQTRTLTYSSGTMTIGGSAIYMASGTITGFDAAHPLFSLIFGGNATIGSDIYLSMVLSTTATSNVSGSYTIYTAGGISLGLYALTVNNVTMTGGTWLGNYTLATSLLTLTGGTISGSVKIAGSLTYTTGTVTTTGSNISVAGGMNLTWSGISHMNNLTFASGNITLLSDVTCDGYVTATSGTPGANGPYTVYANGISSLGTTLTGSATLQLTGGTWSAASSSGILALNTTIAGDVTISGAVYFGGSGKALTYSSGTLTTTGSTVTFSGTTSIINNSGSTMSFYNLTTAASATLTTASNFIVTNAFTNGSGATFTASAGTITFNGIATSISGSGINSFYNLTINPGSTITFPASTTQTISNNFSCTGTAGNLITINSSSPNTAATLSKSLGTVNCDYLSLTDSAAIGGATWNAGANSTGVRTSGWVLGGSNNPPNAPTLVSPSSSSTVVINKPTLSATWSDPDTGDTGVTNYRISTSSLTDCTTNTNVVSHGSSSTTSSNPQTTTWAPSSSIGADGAYYWCAQNQDNSAATSSWTQMGSFVLNTSIPTSTGGSSYNNPTPPSNPSPTPTPPTPTPTTPTIPPTTYTIPTQSLKQGDVSSQVSSLQTLLSLLPGVYPQKIVNGKFGPLTKQAVITFQLKYNLISSAASPAAGLVGPKTLAELKALFTTALQSTTPPTPPTTYTIPAKNLKPGDVSTDVSSLQTLLSLLPGVYPQKIVNGKFGPLTKQAVITFQLKYNLISSAASPAAGLVGPKTIAKLKELFVTITPPITPAPVSMSNKQSLASKSAANLSSGFIAGLINWNTLIYALILIAVCAFIVFIYIKNKK